MKRLVFLINAVCIVGILFSYASPYLAPKDWYIPQLFGLFYNYLLLANSLFLIFWLFFQKRYAIYPFLAIIVGFGFVSRAYKWSEQSTEKQEQTLKLLTYNVKKFGTTSTGKTIDPTPLFEFVKTQKAALSCFQEYSQERYQKYGKKLLQKQYPHTHIDGETATFSKFPIISKQRIVFPKGHYATGILTDIVATQDTLRILNVHLESNQLSTANKQDFEDFVSKKRGLKKLHLVGSKLKKAALHRALQVQKLVEIIKSSPYPVIICGDFNDTPLSYSYQRIKNLLEDSFAIAGKGSGKTFSEGSIKVRIDYIFANATFYQHQVHKVNHSDHKPVTVLFRPNLE